MLQVAMGLTRQTLREGQPPAEFGVTLTGRMRSLSQACQLISKVEWGDVDLRELVLRQLAPHLHTPERGEATGTKMVPRPAGAVAMGLERDAIGLNRICFPTRWAI